MAPAVYIMSALTSLACSVLLLRRYSKTRVRLLLWSGLCFVLLTINNLFVYLDLEMLPDVDLALPRHLSALLGISLLLFGLIWETE